MLRRASMVVAGMPRRWAAAAYSTSNGFDAVFHGKEPHEILGVEKNATVQAIRSAYYRRAMQFHPDRCPTPEQKPEYEKAFTDLTTAYRTILNRTTSEAERAESLEQMRQRIDEVLLGERTSAAAQSFFKSFLRIAGQTYDTLIYEQVKKGDLFGAFELFRALLAEGEQPTRATFEILMRGCTLQMKPSVNFDEADPYTRDLFSTVERLFERMPDFKLKPDVWTFNEMIRASAKCGSYQRAREYFDMMCVNPFTLPTRVVFNSMLEACVKTEEYARAFEVMDEMYEVKRAMWFKGRYRSDAVSMGLLLHSAVEGKLLDKVPRILRLCNTDGLRPDQATGEKLLSECLNHGKPALAEEVASLLKKHGTSLGMVGQRLLRGGDDDTSKIPAP